MRIHTADKRPVNSKLSQPRHGDSRLERADPPNPRPAQKRLRITERNWEAILYHFWRRVARLTHDPNFGSFSERQNRIRQLVRQLILSGMPASVIKNVMDFSAPEWNVSSTIGTSKRQARLAGVVELSIDWSAERIVKRLRNRHAVHRKRQRIAQRRTDRRGAQRMEDQRPDWESRPIPPGAIRFQSES